VTGLPEIPGSERLIVIVGPSGAGKDSVMASWRERLHATPVHFAQRVITRPPEHSEAHEAISCAEFERAASHGEFATWWSANGLHYAVRWRELRPLGESRWVVVNGSRAHLAALRLQAPRLKSVEITADVRVRGRRLQARGRENAEAITDRLRREVPTEADVRVFNDSALSAAVGELHDWWTRLNAGVNVDRPRSR
jgi:ribose 1,5-bisphosphokinase